VDDERDSSQARISVGKISPIEFRRGKSSGRGFFLVFFFFSGDRNYEATAFPGVDERDPRFGVVYDSPRKWETAMQVQCEHV